MEYEVPVSTFHSCTNQEVKAGRSKNKHQCQFCKKFFSRHSHLILHERIHTGEKPYVCQVCNKSFSEKKNLKRHQVVHMPLEHRIRIEITKKHQCQYCKKLVGSRSELIVHERTHTREKPYTCEVCNKSFSRKYTLQKHQVLHMPLEHRRRIALTKKHQCQYCKILVGSRSELIVHELTHTGEKPYTCEVCNKSFSTKPSWQRHQFLHMPSQQGRRKAITKKHQCQFCKKFFCRHSYLICHERIHTWEKPYLCQVCNKSFSKKDQLQKHQVVHMPSQQGQRNAITKKHQCQYCKKLVGYRSELIVHERTHTREKPYTCEVCNKSFSRKYILQKHQVLHMPLEHRRRIEMTKKHQCQYCKMLVGSHSELIAHERTHTGEKPYTCEVCNKSFSMKANCHRHQVLHTRQ